MLAGGDAVIQDQAYLNEINVFPVPDSDTGTNLASTLRSISAGASAHRSIKETLRSIADTALLSARGNSGIIFAQFLQGFSREVEDHETLSTRSFGEAVRKAANHAYQAMATPVEGTMLTVIRDWAEAVYQQRIRLSDFSELLSYSLPIARQSLMDTPKKLKVLAKAGVVDAGAKGFVDFLEGIVQFISQGKLAGISRWKAPIQELEPPLHPQRSSIEQRYCSEALLIRPGIDQGRIRETVSGFGTSAIVAGSEDMARIHVHTDQPEDLFSSLREFGSMTQIKVDDMLRQYEAAHAPKSEIALVTDSSCDLPPEVLDEYQIHLIPFNLSFGEDIFLDRLTITPDRFYSLLQSEKEHPKTSQPSVQTVRNTLAFLSSHYRHVVAIHISDGLTGMYQAGLTARKELESPNIHVIDSRNISVSLGLIVLRAAEAIRDGMGVDELLPRIAEWIDKTSVLVDVKTLKYFVRGGRVSPLKGALARLLHIKPIISLNQEGKSTPIAKSFSPKMTMDKIVNEMERIAEKGPIWNYGIVHALNPERAREYVERLRPIMGMEPAFLTGVSPVIGAHSGIGALGISAMLE